MNSTIHLSVDSSDRQKKPMQSTRFALCFQMTPCTTKAHTRSGVLVSYWGTSQVSKDTHFSHILAEFDCIYCSLPPATLPLLFWNNLLGQYHLKTTSKLFIQIYDNLG